MATDDEIKDAAANGDDEDEVLVPKSPAPYRRKYKFGRTVLFPERMSLGELSAVCGIGSFIILIANNFAGEDPTRPGRRP